MKIYHLGDLHFGKTIYGLNLLKDQRHWTEEFLKLCENEKPDAVVIAGDVYDRSAPSGDAVELLDYLVTRLAGMEIHSFLIAGNHDSGQRLSFANTLLEKEFIHIAGSVEKELKHYTFDNPDGDGPVTIWMMPYTYPEQVSVLFEGDTSGEITADNFRSYESAIKTLLSAQPVNTAERNLLIAHQNITANGQEVEPGGSETMVGGVGQVDYSAFDDFDYVALGHIHSSYSIGRKEVRYAGTPLCYHFDETRQEKKGPVEVILHAKNEEADVNMISIEPLHKMRLVTDTKDNVPDILKNDLGTGEYVSVKLTDQRVKPEIYSFIKATVESKGGILMECISDSRDYSDVVKSASSEAVKEKPLEDLFADLYTNRKGGTPRNDDTYRVLQYVGELVRNRDSHLEVDPADVTKIVKKAKSIDLTTNAEKSAEETDESTTNVGETDESTTNVGKTEGGDAE